MPCKAACHYAQNALVPALAAYYDYLIISTYLRQRRLKKPFFLAFALVVKGDNLL